MEGFGARHRTRADLGAIRHGLYQGLQLAFTRSGVDWDDCYREDRGDGVLILVPPQVPKAVLAAGILVGWPRRCVHTMRSMTGTPGCGCDWRSMAGDDGRLPECRPGFRGVTGHLP